LALKGSKTSSSDKIDPRQHREWVEDLVNLLFQVENDDFSEDIRSKPYLKYKYQSVSNRLKSASKEAFFKAINECLIDHLYVLHPLEKLGYCFLYPKRSIKKTFKE
jgi:hypothetical protein